MWKTTEGGPCIFRPVPYNLWEAPNPEQAADKNCFVGLNQDGTCKIRSSCPNASCNEDNILVGARRVGIQKINVDIPWSENLPDKAKNKRSGAGAGNTLAFPWEIGMYWNLTVGGLNQRAMGCPGIDRPFGSIDKFNRSS